MAVAEVVTHACAGLAAEAGSSDWHSHGGCENPSPARSGELHVHKQQPEKLSTRQGADLAFSLVVQIAEADQAVTVGDDLVLRQHAMLKVEA